MLNIRRSEERGHADHGWLDSHHTFSFADYHDPKHMGFRALRVINEDRVQPGKGFGTHGHQNMEIVSYVLEGAIEHRDSLGTGAVLRPGEVQRMTAGTGVRHSEFNSSSSDPLHFLQIWLLPERQGLEPSYEQRTFPLEGRRNRLRLLASPDGKEESLRIHQDVALYGAVLSTGQSAELPLAPGRHAWVQVARGTIELNGTTLNTGDGAALSDERAVRLVGKDESEVLVFDLA